MTARAMEIEDVAFDYDAGNTALRRISFCIDAGEIVAVMGRNGSGKSTLLKILARLLNPQKGCVRLFGVPLSKLSRLEIASTVGMVMQNPSDQLFGATVRDDVTLGPANLGLPSDEAARVVREALDAVEATALADRPVHQLSFGEQKRVAVAGALAMSPQILLLDEPTSGLDPAEEDRLWALLLRINARKSTTIVMATHSIDLPAQYAHRVLLMDNGCVAGQGATSSVLRDDAALVRAGLRLPYVAALMQMLREKDGLPIHPLPLTARSARESLLGLLFPSGIGRRERRSGGAG